MKLFLISLCFAFAQSAKILGVFNHAGASHTSIGKVLLKNLAKRGHHVTMISSYPMDEPVDNYRDIFLYENLEDFKQREKMYFTKDKTNELETLRNMTLTHTENTFTNPQVKELLESNETFDLVIIDWFFNEASLIFGHRLKAPVIYVSAFGNMLFLNDFTGNTLPYSYVPGAALSTSDEMSFKHRVVMTLLNLGYNLVLPWRNQAQYEILKRHFVDPPSIEELKENIALVLAVSHFSFETSRPYTPSVVPVGGFHIDELKQLPKDLEKFLNSAKNGAIFFSLGSQIKSTNLEKNTFASIVKALGKLPQKILWKYESDDFINLPKNIKIVKWAPQLEILAHPNVKLFISHCGTLSFIESIHFNKPLLCLPFNGDQLTNAAFARSRQFGAHISPDEITEDSLFNKTTEVLTNPLYRKQMNFHSSLLREQPMKPMDLAIFWVEHVINHRTGDHLKTFATKLPWYKYYLVDVIGFFLGVVFIVVKIVLFLIKFVVRRVSRLSKSEIKAKND
ncbi:UDP-glucuronosyltransferase 1-8-like Protein [Tribolium castaneum]|uniref:UDP-glucuronosyltransferase n=4 Tax=Tribolium castaneum TaxID=7070 RepID=D7EL74_TRICA|nr:PREDICTED: UDP-glucuronosyltransferase 1-7 [Tribolium castaneum]EFA11927.1 UDP-glucuronosyltransferase 1-8-like Protein [Tribolium castaneum]|eukprot:XP_973091.2 PREDICTED: UDP-glucuronosyltransferase 1-7 [Tribolium castaneum]